MSKNSMVSVIVACYNGEHYVKKCIESLLIQTYPDVEIIICDDASTDSSFEILEAYAQKDNRIVLLRNESNLFSAVARNRCIEVSKGEYLVIQDIDDYSTVDRIEKLVRVLEGTPDVDLVSSAAYYFDKNEEISTRFLNAPKKHPVKKDFLWGNAFVHATTIFRTKALKDVGGYRIAPETRRGQDYDLFMRLYAAGHKGMNIDEPLYWIRADANMRKRQLLSSAKQEAKVRAYGYKQLGLLPIGYLFCLKPYVAHLYYLIRNIMEKN